VDPLPRTPSWHSGYLVKHRDNFKWAVLPTSSYFLFLPGDRNEMGVPWIQVIRDRFQLQAFVNTVMNLRFSGDLVNLQT
jgi:hypothetical protein